MVFYASASAAAKHCDMWLACHVLRKARTCDSMLASFLYLGYEKQDQGVNCSGEEGSLGGVVGRVSSRTRVRGRGGNSTLRVSG